MVEKRLALVLGFTGGRKSAEAHPLAKNDRVVHGAEVAVHGVVPLIREGVE
jgi:hypothetical protein